MSPSTVCLNSNNMMIGCGFPWHSLLNIYNLYISEKYEFNYNWLALKHLLKQSIFAETNLLLRIHRDALGIFISIGFSKVKKIT